MLWQFFYTRVFVAEFSRGTLSGLSANKRESAVPSSVIVRDTQASLACFTMARQLQLVLLAVTSVAAGLAAGAPVAEPLTNQTFTWTLSMPDVNPPEDDIYLCRGYRVPDGRTDFIGKSLNATVKRYTHRR